MSLSKHWRFILAVVVLCVGGGVWWSSAEREKAPLAIESSDTAGWQRIDVQSLKWSGEKLWGRVSGMRWMVDYEYIVDGTSYRGNNINARLTAIRVGYGDYSIDMTVRLNEIKSVWYDPKAPSRSAVFKSVDTDISSELREAYAELTARAKREGRWP